MDLLKNVPSGLKDPLFEEYNKVVRNFRERRWEPAELNGGKLCEIVYTIIKGHIDGSYPASPSKPANMVDSCRALEQLDSSKYPRSVRIQIPRIILGLYEIRNNRGVGHAGGEVNPNEMDASATLSMCKWLMSELIRIFHGISTQDATDAVSAVTERIYPIVWEIDGKKRILAPKTSQKDKTLLLLYSCPSGTTEDELLNWTEHTNPSIYRRDVLKTLHKDRLIEYSQANKTAKISPTGIQYVETNLPLEFNSSH